jgi:hypothetical protein
LKKMNDIMKATETLQRLEADLAKATDRATTLQTERRKLSFAAHSGDKPARAKLDKLTAESAGIALEVENLKAAIDEGRQRLVEANRQADLAQKKADALSVKEVAGRISTHGPAISAAIDALRDSFVALTADLRTARELGCELAPSRLVELSFAEAISSALRPAGLELLLDLAPPHRRRSAEALTAGYADRATTWAASVFDESKAELI